LDYYFWKFIIYMKKIVGILGSTGSIGKLSLEIINKDVKSFDVQLISGNTNYELLTFQAKKFKPKFIYLPAKSNNFYFLNFCKKNQIRIITNINELDKKIKFDIVISTISGIAGLIPTLNIIKYTKKIAIANKESIICGWKFINNELRKNFCEILPLDSEHFSIFNLIKDKNNNLIKNIFLTASGGPFLNKRINLKNVSVKQVINHPVWKMGKKISVDSANLMNKVLEVIEASLLFGLPLNKFSIAIHPQSLVHAIVEYKNGLTFFSYHEPDMKIPITNALYDNFSNKSFFKDSFFNNKNNKKLFFTSPDIKNYPALNVLQIAKLHGTNGYIFINILNELLVNKFFEKKILFIDIVNELLAYMRLKQVKNYLKNNKIKHINDVFKAYNFCKKLII